MSFFYYFVFEKGYKEKEGGHIDCVCLVFLLSEKVFMPQRQKLEHKGQLENRQKHSSSSNDCSSEKNPFDRILVPMLMQSQMLTLILD